VWGHPKRGAPTPLSHHNTNTKGHQTVPTQARRLALLLISALTATTTSCAKNNNNQNAANDTNGNTVLVRFHNETITRAMLNHWIAIEAVIAPETNPQQPPPPGQIPDPPNYTHCIPYQKQHPETPTTTPLTTTQARTACHYHYEHLRLQMLALLTNYIWVNHEANTLHIHITQAAINQAETRFNQANFHTPEAFQRFLKASGETHADHQRIIQFDLQATAIRTNLLNEHNPTQLQNYNHQTAKQLQNQTTCAPEDIFQDCRGYKGPEPPG